MYLIGILLYELQKKIVNCNSLRKIYKVDLFFFNYYYLNWCQNLEL